MLPEKKPVSLPVISGTQKDVAIEVDGNRHHHCSTSDPPEWREFGNLEPLSEAVALQTLHRSACEWEDR